MKFLSIFAAALSLVASVLMCPAYGKNIQCENIPSVFEVCANKHWGTTCGKYISPSGGFIGGVQLVPKRHMRNDYGCTGAKALRVKKTEFTGQCYQCIYFPDK